MYIGWDTRFRRMLQYYWRLQGGWCPEGAAMLS